MQSPRSHGCGPRSAITKFVVACSSESCSGNKSFIQIAALAIAGVDLSDSDARLLDHVGVLTQLADPRIWPLTVTRRVASNGGSLAESVVAGLATLCTEQMTALPVAGFMRYLDRVAAMTAAGASVKQAVAETVGAGERVPGVGRPVLGNDERVPPKLDLRAAPRPR